MYPKSLFLIKIHDSQKKYPNYTSSVEQNFHLYPAYFSATLMEDDIGMKLQEKFMTKDKRLITILDVPDAFEYTLFLRQKRWEIYYSNRSVEKEDEKDRDDEKLSEEDAKLRRKFLTMACRFGFVTFWFRFCSTVCILLILIKYFQIIHIVHTGLYGYGVYGFFVIKDRSNIFKCFIHFQIAHRFHKVVGN